MEENQAVAKRSFLDYLMPMSILFSAVLIAGALLYTNVLKNNDGGSKNIPESANLLDANSSLRIESYDVVLGDPEASVTLIEFGDYQCPFCGKLFLETERLIRNEYI